ncbi:MAG TPA: hypothetical protein DEG76_11540 [Pseudohongiella sp.]|nr:hypothetical protein [Pseudohongiella sp.]HBX37875.1 hypothetical protein [Pseudohongiella sp.]|tara:strand:+ start:5546 stop:6202 length:657 start_codon:yes stop_codon:yes gene_type:complete
MEGKEYVQDPLRAIDKVFQADKRYADSQISVEDVHRALAPIVLSDSVPTPVRQLFETAKNVSLYAWFVYRFHQVSEMVAYSALEMALKSRYLEKNPDCDPKSTPRGLKKLLKYAQTEKWIENSKFSFGRALARRRILDRQRDEIIQSGILKSPGDSIEMTEPAEADIDVELHKIDIVAGIVERQANIRNDLAHGSTRLDHSSVSRLSKVAEIINQVYS